MFYIKKDLNLSHIKFIYLECGAEVIAWDIDKKALNKAQENLKNEKFIIQIVDITNFDEVKKNIELIVNKKKIDIFINNAGIAGLNSKVWDYPITPAFDALYALAFGFPSFPAIDAMFTILP